MKDDITLHQAAEIAAYRDAATLRIAANKGRLRTVKPGSRLHMTKRVWRDEYLTSWHPGNDKRGLRKGQDAGEAQNNGDDAG